MATNNQRPTGDDLLWLGICETSSDACGNPELQLYELQELLAPLGLKVVKTLEVEAWAQAREMIVAYDKDTDGEIDPWDTMDNLYHLLIKDGSEDA